MGGHPERVPAHRHVYANDYQAAEDDGPSWGSSSHSAR